MFTMCYTRSSIIDISLFRKSELRDEGGNKMGKIMAVNISEKKGTQKKNVHSARLMEEFGIEKDAHAGKWHRQVSLLSYEKIEEFKAKGAPIEDGAFGENLIVSFIIPETNFSVTDDYPYFRFLHLSRMYTVVNFRSKQVDKLSSRTYNNFRIKKHFVFL